MIKYAIQWDNMDEPRIVNREAAEKHVEIWNDHVKTHDWTVEGSLDGGDLTVHDNLGATVTIRPVTNV